MISPELLRKYDVPAPRYTSYPTVPYWQDSPTTQEWLDSLAKSLDNEKTSWSMYLHIPFCETLCTFCGCNTSITKNHKLESPYVKTILTEWQTYLEKLPEFKKRQLKHVHLGGGTPTFLSADQLHFLMESILKDTAISQNEFEGSIEVDPRRTNADQLKALRELGFNRISLGVQDFNPEVQKIVNRVQPFELTQSITYTARDLGYESVNYDLIYGLPKQTEASVAKMSELTVELRPDRIALYSFAMVPWIKPAQRLFKDEDVPVGESKRKLYEVARSILLSAGYVEIGMDHFALPNEALTKAFKNASLHRNFMGYTDHRTEILLGLGVSAISESPTCFHQNEKVLPVYEKQIAESKIATFRGHKLSNEDLFYREQILTLMTLGAVKLKDHNQEEDVKNFLHSMIEDQLVQIESGVLKMTELGRPFLRNAGMALDKRLRSKQPSTRVFSQSL